jgi:hypothetical protein
MSLKPSPLANPIEKSGDTLMGKQISGTGGLKTTNKMTNRNFETMANGRRRSVKGK